MFNSTPATNFLTKTSTTSFITSTTIPYTTQPNDNRFWEFSNSYRPIHGWLSTFVCLFGIPSNLLNIIVLTRPNMVCFFLLIFFYSKLNLKQFFCFKITSPTNLILSGLAVSDLLTMITYLPFSIYYYIIYAQHSPNTPSPERDTHFMTHFTQIHVMASVTFHCISIWLTVYLACFRYIYIASSSSAACGIPNTNNSNKSKSNGSSRSKKSSITNIFQRCILQCRTYNCTLFGMLNICIFCILFCFPAYLYPAVREKFLEDSSASTQPIKYYIVDQSDLNIKTNGLISKIMFYSQAILGKFLPCLFLVTFSSLLIHSLVIINRNKKKLSKSYEISLRINHKQLPETTTTIVHQQSSSMMSKPFKYLTNNLPKLKKNQATNTESTPQESYVTIKLEEMNQKDSNEINFLSSEVNLKKYTSAPNISQKESSKKAKSSANINDKKSSYKRRSSDINVVPKCLNSSLTKTKINEIDEKADEHKHQNDNKVLSRASSITKKRKSKKSKPKRNRAKENLRTTMMLIIVCILFLITEFPQSILLFFAIIMDESYYQNVYMPLGDLLDIIALINNSINFLLYCSMSRAFRNTFYKLVMSIWCCKHIQASNISIISCKNHKDKMNNFSVFTENSGYLLNRNNNNKNGNNNDINNNEINNLDDNKIEDSKEDDN